jgi:hypothetical protein
LATVTFHSVIQTPIVGGGFRENADLQFIRPAPAPLLFCLVDHTLGIALVPVLDVYWMQWSHNYTIVVGEVIWETFTYQEQLSRSTTLHPVPQHNLLNDDLQDFPMNGDDDEEDEEDEEDEDEDEDL